MKHLKVFNEHVLSNDEIDDLIEWNDVNYMIDKLTSLEDDGYGFRISIGCATNGCFDNRYKHRVIKHCIYLSGKDSHAAYSSVYAIGKIHDGNEIVDAFRNNYVIYFIECKVGSTLANIEHPDYSDLKEEVIDCLSKKFIHIPNVETFETALLFRTIR